MLIRDSQRRNEQIMLDHDDGRHAVYSRDRPGSIQRPPRFPGISRQCEHSVTGKQTSSCGQIADYDRMTIALPINDRCVHKSRLCTGTRAC
jgi:hypothetical protein